MRFEQIPSKGIRKAILVATGIAVLSWVINSLFDAFVFHENTFEEELFSPGHRELSMRLAIMFGAAFFTFAYLRLRQTSLLLAAEVSERTREGEELRRTKNLLQSVVKNTTDAIYVKDLTGRYQLFNAAAERFVSKSASEVLGRDDTFIFPEPDAKAVMAEDRRVMESGRVHTYEEKVRTAGGGFVIFLATKGPVFDTQGTVRGLFGISRDITERKQLEIDLFAAKETAENATRTKAKFLDTAAHELRNPVTAISLLLHVVQKKTNNGETLSPATLALLREPVDRLTHLVVDLLDVSQAERGLMVLRPVPCDIVSLISKCLEEFLLRASNRRINFAKPENPIEIDLDPVRINQVMANLIDNAMKYTPEDCPIEVAIETMPAVIRVLVIDHGAGIPQESLQDLFAAFARGRSEATIRSSHGLGLGLSICRGIIELHGGTIHASSEIGRGSTFFFELPRKGTSHE